MRSERAGAGPVEGANASPAAAGIVGLLLPPSPTTPITTAAQITTIPATATAGRQDGPDVRRRRFGWCAAAPYRSRTLFCTEWTRRSGTGGPPARSSCATRRSDSTCRRTSGRAAQSRSSAVPASAPGASTSRVIARASCSSGDCSGCIAGSDHRRPGRTGGASERAQPTIRKTQTRWPLFHRARDFWRPSQPGF